MPGHVPPDFGEVGFAGARFIDELAVKHHHQAIRQFEQQGVGWAKPSDRANARADGVPTILLHPKWWARRKGAFAHSTKLRNSW
jgi:hypothetical protein